MDSTITIFLRPGDTPRGLMSPSVRWGDIPVLELGADERYPCLQFDPGNYDTAVTYLDHLAAEASSLAARIRVAQRQAALLAEVQATPHDPQAAAQIRASYADEAVQ